MSTDYRIDGTTIDLHPERVAAWLRGERVYPLYLEIAPAGGCNHRCTFCAVDYLGYETRFLDADVMRGRLCELGALGVKSVMWAGEGEPLLHRRLSEMIVAGKDAGVDQAITTNAVALTERFCEAALPALTWIKASINAGTAADYARIHQAGPKDWLRVWANLARAVRMRDEAELPVSLGAQMVLLPDNADHVPELIQYCYDTGLDYLVIKPYSHQAKSLTRVYSGLGYWRYLGYADEWRAKSTPTFQVIVRTDTMLRVTGDRGYAKCQATPHFWAYVMASGDVYACSAYLGDRRFRLGNILAEPFHAIWNSDARADCQRFVDTELDIVDCRKSCRMDHANRYLSRLKHPEGHDNFI